MMLDLTKQYSALFRKQGGKRLFLFAHDVFKSGKLREFTSFIAWELLHQLRLFPSTQYIQFKHPDALSLNSEVVAGDQFQAKVAAFFESRGLGVSRCPQMWKLLFVDGRNQVFGSYYPNDCDMYKTVAHDGSPVFLQRFPDRIKAIFVSSRGTIFVCIKGAVYTSSDDGVSFQKSLDLGSEESFFRFNNGVTETPDQTVVIGEYGNVWDKNGWRKLAYLYFTSDEGRTWEKSDYLIKKGTNKHVHVVKYSKLLARLLVADGDNYKKLWISTSLDVFDAKNPGFRAVNKFHFQMGGYTSMVESSGRILFGTDYQGGTNFIVVTANGAKYRRWIVPDPYRRSPVDNMVQRKSKTGTEIWANLPFSTASTKCLLMYTMDCGETWNKVLEYDSAAYKVWLLNASDQIQDTLYFSIQDLRNNDRVAYKISDPA